MIYGPEAKLGHPSRTPLDLGRCGSNKEVPEEFQGLDRANRRRSSFRTNPAWSC